MIECEEKLSVIIPTYNHKDTIARSLNAVLMQKTDCDFTIWIADDSSTDGTSEIIQEIIKTNQNKHATINHIISEKNLGFRNTVIHFDNVLTSEELKNQYVAVCDGDDYWINDCKLQQQYDILRHDKESISICDSFICIDPDRMFLCQHNAKIIQKNKAVIEPINPISQGSSVMFKNVIDWGYFPDLFHLDAGWIKIFNFYGNNIFREITTHVYDQRSQGISVQLQNTAKDSMLEVKYIMYLIIRIIHYLKTNENFLSEKDHNYLMTQFNADLRIGERIFIDDKILSFVEQYKNKRNKESIPHYEDMLFAPLNLCKIL